MKLKLSVVESTGSGSWADVTEHGTLKDQLEKTDILSFSNKNLESDSQVVLFIKETPDGAPKMLCLSARLSKLVRKAINQGVKRMEVLRAMIDLKVIENEVGYFLVPDGKPSEGATLEQLLSGRTEGKPVTLEMLIA